MATEAYVETRQQIEGIYSADSRRVFASLVRLLRDLDLAEEATHEAFTAAIERWPVEGIRANPRAWLVSTGRFKAIDALRRRGKFDEMQLEVAERQDEIAHANASRARLAIEAEGIPVDSMGLQKHCQAEGQAGPADGFLDSQI